MSVSSYRIKYKCACGVPEVSLIVRKIEKHALSKPEDNKQDLIKHNCYNLKTGEKSKIISNHIASKCEFGLFLLWFSTVPLRNYGADSFLA